jgi:hypothetical protein
MPAIGISELAQEFTGRDARAKILERIDRLAPGNPGDAAASQGGQRRALRAVPTTFSALLVMVGTALTRLCPPYETLED